MNPSFPEVERPTLLACFEGNGGFAANGGDGAATPVAEEAEIDTPDSP